MAMSDTMSIRTALNDFDDKRIQNIRPCEFSTDVFARTSSSSNPTSTVLPPQILNEEFPISSTAAETIYKGRTEVDSIIKGRDDRLVVVVGPCSVHDVAAGLEYARLLKDYADKVSDDLCIVMR